MKRLAPILAAACLLTVAARAQELDPVLQRHAEARGGMAAIEAIQSVDVQLTINEGWEVDAHYRATRDGDMRIDVFADGERVFTEALDQKKAWSLKKGEEKGAPITEEEGRILWRGVLGNVYGLHELAGQGVRVSVSGPEELDGESYWVVDLVHEDGFEDRYYLDAETYLVARQRSDHALHPAVDPEVRRFESRYSDYREVDGVLCAFLIEKFDLDSGGRVQLTTVRSRESNTTEDRSIFLMPTEPSAPLEVPGEY